MCGWFFPLNIPIPGRDIILYTSYFQESISIRHIIPKANSNTAIEIYDALQTHVIRWSMDDKRDKIII
jgi:hypothetical protein